MSVLMTLRVSGDAKAIEAVDQATFDTVVQRAKDHGLIRHRFFGSDSEILVVDEWPDEASFQAFVDASPEIGEMMAAAGATSEPTIEFWRPLDTNDAMGW
jgi:quinol monooxygenase YgiN